MSREGGEQFLKGKKICFFSKAIRMNRYSKPDRGRLFNRDFSEIFHVIVREISPREAGFPPGRPEAFAILRTPCDRSNGNPDTARGGFASTTHPRRNYSLALTVRGVISSSDPQEGTGRNVRITPQSTDTSLAETPGHCVSDLVVRLRLCVSPGRLSAPSLASDWWRHPAPSRRTTMEPRRRKI